MSVEISDDPKEQRKVDISGRGEDEILLHISNSNSDIDQPHEKHEDRSR